MPTLTCPTAKTLTKALTRAIDGANARKFSANRLLDAAVVPLVVAEVLKTAEGTMAADGGAQANSYPARTVALAVAWFTRLDGVKIVRVRCRLVTLVNPSDPVVSPFITADVPASACPLLASGELLETYRSVGEMPDAVAQAVAANPADLTAWAVLADYLDELADVLTDDAQAEVAARAARIRALVGVVAYAKK